MDPHSSTETQDGGLGWSRTEQVLRVLAGCVEARSVADTLETTAEFVRRLSPQGISLGLYANSSAGRVVVSASAERPDPNRHCLLTMECSGDRIRIETRHPGRDPVSFDYPMTLGLEPILEEMIRLAQMRSWQDPDRRE
jgi:hypothetical protein